MPFTFSHPAIILPLTLLPRKWVSVTGLIVGSLVPDFEYFIRFRIHANYSHTLTGLLWFCLPLGLLLAWVYHNIVRDSLMANLPPMLKNRVAAFSGFKWDSYARGNIIIVALSILVGAASHLFWDGFTHIDGRFVAAIPSLSVIINLFGYPVPLYKVLQHVSTLVGGLAIFFTVMALPRGKAALLEANPRYCPAVLLVSVIITSFRLLVFPAGLILGDLIVTVIAAGLCGLVAAPMLLKLRLRPGR